MKQKAAVLIVVLAMLVGAMQPSEAQEGDVSQAPPTAGMTQPWQAMAAIDAPGGVSGVAYSPVNDAAWFSTNTAVMRTDNTHVVQVIGERPIMGDRGVVPVLQSEFEFPPDQEFSAVVPAGTPEAVFAVDWVSANEPYCYDSAISNGCFGKDLSLLLIDPNGLEVNPAHLDYTFEDIAMGKAGFRITNPVAGTWTLVVNADSVYVWYPVEFEVYAAVAAATNPIFDGVKALHITDAGEVYVPQSVADDSLSGIKVLNSSGNLIREFGDKNRFAGGFTCPSGAHVDGNRVYVMDFVNPTLQVVDTSGALLDTMSSTALGNCGDRGMTMADDEIYVTSCGGNEVSVLDTDGVVLRQWGSLGSGNSQLRCPTDIAVANGLVYVADSGNDRVQVFSIGGAFQQSIGTSGTGLGQFDTPTKVDVNPAGTMMWVGEQGNQRLQTFTTGFTPAAFEGNDIVGHSVSTNASGDMVMTGMSRTGQWSIRRYTNGSGWGHWVKVGAGGWASSTAVIDSFGVVQLAGVKNSGRLYTRHWASDGYWSDWVNHGSDTWATDTAPSLATNGSKLVLAAVKADGRLYTRQRVDFGSWAGFKRHGATGWAGVAVDVAADGDVWFVATKNDGRLYVRKHIGTWSGFAKQGAPTWDPAAQPAIDAANDQVVWAAVKADGRLYTRTQTFGTWAGYVKHGASGWATVDVVSSNGTFWLAATKQTGRLYTRPAIGSGWGGWQRHGLDTWATGVAPSIVVYGSTTTLVGVKASGTMYLRQHASGWGAFVSQN